MGPGRGAETAGPGVWGWGGGSEAEHEGEGAEGSGGGGEEGVWDARRLLNMPGIPLLLSFFLGGWWGTCGNRGAASRV